ncbi:MAG: MBL fold metallo-hydrolase [Verrucomicrobia bacterium]|jgi:metallo-beta-lactamase family protein|nr:MBL fold metallo-hydrolase [Verrucomicrobiota bacterium]
MDIKLRFLGAAQNVTGSCHLLEANGVRVLVDCGLYQERDFKKRNWEPFAEDPSTIDAVVLTHAHLDHCGLLPKLVKDGFEGPVFATEATADIAEIVMRDSAKIQSEDIAYKKRRHKKQGKSSPYPYEPLYRTEDVERVLPMVQPIRYGKEQKVGVGLTLKFLDAGHILGSSSVLFETTNHGSTRRILFSGDIGRWDTPILRDPELAEQADYVCIESTYGNRDHKDNSSIPDTLARVVKAAHKAGGNVVIPSFAIERTQELLYRLGELRAEGRIPEVPVYVDSPMAIRVTEVFKRHRELFDEETMDRIANGQHPCDFKGLSVTRKAAESKAINNQGGTSIIIAGSGMCTGGRIKHHIANNIERPESVILFVGYQANGTLGRHILQGAETVRLFGERHEVLARIEKVNGMSAHADRSELLRWLKGLQSAPKKVFVIHGEERATESFAQLVHDRLGWDAEVATYQQEVQLD